MLPTRMIAVREQVLGRIGGGLVPALRPAAGTSETGSQPKNEEGYDLFLRSTAIPHAADATAMPAAWQTLILRVYSGRFERIVPTQSFADK